MKTEFEARPVYVRREDRIKAHFMTCYISLLLYRLLEKKLGDAYTVSQILGTLRSMQMTLLNTASGYIPSYTRTELTDSLHKTFGMGRACPACWVLPRPSWLTKTAKCCPFPAVSACRLFPWIPS